jgi:ribonucleotide monophosphatase NagD (HAD superfamily)
VTDIVAGQAAGCRTALVHSGRHEDAPIVSADPLPDDVTPDFTGADLAAVADWILR